MMCARSATTVPRLHQQADERQRHLFDQVGPYANQLAEYFESPVKEEEAEQIVDHLEAMPRLKPCTVARARACFLPKKAFTRPSMHRQSAPSYRRGTRSLRANDVEGSSSVIAGVAVLGELINHLQSSSASSHSTRTISSVVCQGERHRLDVEVVAEKHRDVAAPNGHGRAGDRGVPDSSMMSSNERGG